MTVVTPLKFTGDRPRIPLPGSIVERFPDANHARWGLGASPNLIPTYNLTRIGQQNNGQQSVATLTHPLYDLNINNWAKWRLTYEGGDKFIEAYTKQFSRLESVSDFQKRKEITPVPAFAKGAINEIKNAIFQRASDTTRKGGPNSYQKAVQGLSGGVDLKGATMNWFVGHYVLPELLTMKKVGVYVDNPPKADNLAIQQTRHPYFYIYRAEDIRSWAYAPATDTQSGEFTSVLLREYQYIYDDLTGLPMTEVERFRHVFIGPDLYVHIQFYDLHGIQDGPEQILEIRRIPFTLFEISDSLLKDVANTQIALLNLESSDISYALKGNFPFYVEQYNPRDNTPSLRAAQQAFMEMNPGTDPSCQTEICATGEETRVGSTQGRRYPINTDQPAFINPSPEPLQASMEKQQVLKADIRQLVHLALSTIQPKMASAESKSLDQQGLESGLSYIGLELERGERLLAQYWTDYDGGSEIPTVNYPKQWSLKSIEQTQKEVLDLQTVRDDLPSPTFKKEINKRIANLVLGNSVTAGTLDTIQSELDKAAGSTSNPKLIINDVEAGLLSLDTATQLRGYDSGEVPAAKADHAERLARIAESQSSGKALSKVAESTAVDGLKNPAGRGLPDLSVNPSQQAANEKIGRPGRGAA